MYHSWQFYRPEEFGSTNFVLGPEVVPAVGKFAESGEYEELGASGEFGEFSEFG